MQVHTQVFRAVAVASPSSSVSCIRRWLCAGGGETVRPGHPLHTSARESSQKHLWAHSRLFFSRREPLLPHGMVPSPAPAQRQHLGLSWMTGPAVAFPTPTRQSCLTPHPYPAPLGGRGQQSSCTETTLSSGLTQGSHRRADQTRLMHLWKLRSPRSAVQLEIQESQWYHPSLSPVTCELEEQMAQVSDLN